MLFSLQFFGAVHFYFTGLNWIFGRIQLTPLAVFSIQILTEQVCTQVVHKPHPEPDSTIKIQNPSEYKHSRESFLRFGLPLAPSLSI